MRKIPVNILAIETSCDETAASVISKTEAGFIIRSNMVSSQVALHAKWGGVVPSLAAREHAKNIVPVLDQAVKNADMSPEDIDLIAVTSGPGLIPALLIGVDAAKTLAYAWEKPLIGVHHIAGHIYANFICDKIGKISNLKSQISNPSISEQNSNEVREANEAKFPILCLVVSGGHTQLVLMMDHVQYEIVGETQDDAAGEAFDKVARILDLGYPGGPAIAAAAANFKSNTDDRWLMTSDSIRLPRPMMHSPNLNFSFSGLKTAVLYETKKHPELLRDQDYISFMAYEFQQAAIDVLIHKTLKAAKKYNPQTIMLAGGVSANTELRTQLGENVKANLKNTLYMIPDTLYTGDNAAMIAAAAYFQWQMMDNENQKSAFDNWQNLEANASLKMA